MKKLNERYTTIAVYALITVAFCVVFSLICINFPTVWNGFRDALFKISAILYAILLSLLLLPIVKFFEKQFEKLLCRKKPHPRLVTAFAIILAYLIALILLAIIFGSIIPALIININDFASTFRTKVVSLQLWLKYNTAESEILSDIADQVVIYLKEIVMPGDSPTALVGRIVAILSSVVTEISDIIIGAMLSVYILLSRRLLSGLSGKLIAAVFPKKSAIHLVVFFKRLYTDFCSFAGTRFWAAFCLSAAMFVFSWLLGIPMFSLLIVILLVTYLIPVVGPILGMLLSTALVLLLAPGRTWLFILILTAVELAVSYFLLPAILPKKLRPSYALTATLVIIGNGFFGIIGAFLALPLYTTLNVEFRTLLTHRLAKKNLPLTTESYAEFDYDAYAAMAAPPEQDELSEADRSDDAPPPADTEQN